MNAYNPFREKAIKARALSNRLNGPTAHERGMAAVFPLGAGFGYGSQWSRNKRMDASIDRAGKALAALHRANALEAAADAYDRGECDSRGRVLDAASLARAEKRYSAKEKRDAKIATAKAEVEAKGKFGVTAEVWATAHGYLAGSGRALTIYDWEQAKLREVA